MTLGSSVMVCAHRYELGAPEAPTHPAYEIGPVSTPTHFAQSPDVEVYVGQTDPVSWGRAYRLTDSDTRLQRSNPRRGSLRTVPLFLRGDSSWPTFSWEAIMRHPP